MSSKGRGRHEGGAEDYYPTPAWCVHRLLDDCGEQLCPLDGYALEPTCGDGAIIRAADEWYRARRSFAAPSWTGVELRRGALGEDTPLMQHHEGVDYRAWTAPCRYDLALGNPPFSLAEQIVRHALSHATVVAMLLRVGFLGSDERVAFFRTVGARPALRVLPDRPSFDGEGTDSSTYAWFVWGAPEVTGVVMLDSTPLAVRNAQKPQGLAFEARQRGLFTEVA